MKVTQPIEWTEQGVVMVDQRRLPGEVIRNTYTTYHDVATAITDMVIRGAPAIGVAAAMGFALGVLRSTATSVDELRGEVNTISETLARTRDVYKRQVHCSAASAFDSGSLISAH